MSVPQFELNADHVFATADIVQQIRIYPGHRVPVSIRTGDMVVADTPCTEWTWCPALGDKWSRSKIDQFPWLKYLPKGAKVEIECDQITTLTMKRSRHVTVEDNMITMMQEHPWLVPWHTRMKYRCLQMINWIKGEQK